MSPTVILPVTRSLTATEAHRIIKAHAKRQGDEHASCLAAARGKYGLHTAEGRVQLDGTRYYLRTPGRGA